MKRMHMLLLALTIGLPAGLAAQATPPAEPPAAVAPAVEPGDNAEAEARAAASRRDVVRIAQDYTLSSGDGVSEAVVILGRATIEGRVYGDVVVILGAVQLASTAVIDGDLVVVGGGTAVTTGAQVYGDLVVVGGGYDAPAEFAPGGEHVVIGPAMLGGRLDALVPWITRGLLWGRPIVPDLPWVWGVVALVFLVSLALNLLFDRPVRACAETLLEKPLTTFAVGLLVLLLAGPVCLLLMVSVIGIAVVPFVLCALLLAWVIGKVGVARGIGMTILRQTWQGSHAQAILAFIIGFAVICVAYMVPVLGFATWAMTGVLGLGAATLAVIAGYRRENPAPLPRVPAVAATPPRWQGGEATPPVAEAAVEPFDSAATTPPMVAASDLLSFPRARFRDRLAAFVLDVILVVISQQLLDLTTRDSAIFLLLLAYHIGFWTWKGTTVGGIICQLRVIRVDATPLRFVDALVRGLSSIFSLAVLGLGCLWILKDPERQAWHDKIAGTYVVKVPRNFPL
jgi:uncharacterized RDD family membrane protein YckC